MKNKIVLVFMLALTLAACNKTNKSAETEPTAPKEAFVVDSINYTDSIAMNDKVSAVYGAKLLYFPSIKDQTILDSIYSDYTDGTQFDKTSILESLKAKSKTYFDENKEGAGDFGHQAVLAQKSTMSVLYHDHDFLALQDSYFWDGGGAHPNSGQKDRVYDLKNNKSVQLSDITTLPAEKISALLMTNVQKLEIANMAKEAGADLLLVDTIPVTRNFYFDNENIYFHYDPYEIAAYVYGNIDIPISWSMISESLTPEFKERMGIK